MNFTKVAAVMVLGCTNLLFGVKEKTATPKTAKSVTQKSYTQTQEESQAANIQWLKKNAQKVIQKQLRRLEYGNPLPTTKMIDIGSDWTSHYIQLTAVVLLDKNAPRLEREAYREGKIAVVGKTVLII